MLLIVRSGRNHKLSQLVLGDADINTFFEKMRKDILNIVGFSVVFLVSGALHTASFAEYDEFEICNFKPLILLMQLLV
jgi:hypothetical protein